MTPQGALFPKPMKGDDPMNMPTQSRPAFRAGRRHPWARSAGAGHAGILPLMDEGGYDEDDMESADEYEMAGEDSAQE
jgi:hypothetical protein